MSVEASAEPAAIFRREGDRWFPSIMAQGPWSEHHLHGGAICGVLGHAIEGCESPVPMRVARMTVEMTRAVPMEPFTARARISRAGRRIQQIDARIEAGGKTLARATALRMRVNEGNGDPEASIPLHEEVPARTPTPPTALTVEPMFFPGFISAIEFWRSQIAKPGGFGVSWARLRKPLVEGEEPSAFVRLATICDFASGAGNAIDYRKFTTINPDLSLHVVREPRGEWIGLKGWTHLEPDGIGQSHALLFDEEGVVARALVTLLVERRPASVG